jgi:hypothetical protein
MQDLLLLIGVGLLLNDYADDLIDRPGPAEGADRTHGRPEEVG